MKWDSNFGPRRKCPRALNSRASSVYLLLKETTLFDLSFNTNNKHIVVLYAHFKLFDKQNWNLQKHSQKQWIEINKSIFEKVCTNWKKFAKMENVPEFGKCSWIWKKFMKFEKSLLNLKSSSNLKKVHWFKKSPFWKKVHRFWKKIHQFWEKLIDFEEKSISLKKRFTILKKKSTHLAKKGKNEQNCCKRKEMKSKTKWFQEKRKKMNEQGRNK